MVLKTSGKIINGMTEVANLLNKLFTSIVGDTLKANSPPKK